MQQLGQRFNFTPDDLVVNRGHKLSQRQYDMIAAGCRNWPRKMLIIATVLGLYFGYHVGSYTAPPFDYTEGAIGFAGAFICSSMVMWPLYWTVFGRHLRSGKIQSVTGRVSHRTEGLPYARVHGTWVTPQKKRHARYWNRNPGDTDLFEGIEWATLYYTQGWATTRIHSIEPALPPEWAHA